MTPLHWLVVPWLLGAAMADLRPMAAAMDSGYLDVGGVKLWYEECGGRGDICCSGIRRE